MRLIVFTAGAALSALALGAQGPQTPPSVPATRVPTAADSAIWRAIRLPAVLQRARTAGVSDSVVRGVLDAVRRGGLPAEEAVETVESELEEIERGGSKDNFGSFVRAQVESGLRGRDLAESLRAERAKRGMGRPADAGRPGGAGRQNQTGRDSARGKSAPSNPRRP